MRPETGRALLFLCPAVVYLLVVTLLFFIYTISVSLHDWYLSGDRRFCSIENDLTLLKDFRFWASLKITVHPVSACHFLHCLFGCSLALMLSLISRRKRVFAVFFGPPVMLRPMPTLHRRRIPDEIWCLRAHVESRV